MHPYHGIITVAHKARRCEEWHEVNTVVLVVGPSSSKDLLTMLVIPANTHSIEWLRQDGVSEGRVTMLVPVDH